MWSAGSAWRELPGEAPRQEMALPRLQPGSPSGHSRLHASSHVPSAVSLALQCDLRRDAAPDHLVHPADTPCSPCPPGRENRLCTLLCPLGFAHNSCHNTSLAQALSQQQTRKSEGSSLQRICPGSTIPTAGLLLPPQDTSSFPSDPGSLPLRLLPFWVINSV